MGIYPYDSKSGCFRSKYLDPDQSAGKLMVGPVDRIKYKDHRTGERFLL